MSETRFTAAQISHLVDECAHNGTEARIFHVLKQAAQDARVIEQLRAWANGDDLRRIDPAHNYYSPEMTMRRRVLAELDRLAPPQRQE